MRFRDRRRFRRQISLAQCVLDSLESRRLLSGAPPTPAADSYDASEDVTLIADVSAGVLANDSDPENDDLVAYLDTDVSHGTLTLNPDGSFTYTPDENFNGSDAFTYMVDDGLNLAGPIMVTITVESVNDDPVAEAGGPYTVAEDQTVILSSAGSSDVDGTIDSVVWDLDEDGTFGETGVDALRGAENVANPEFLADNVEGPASFTVTVRVTDNNGGISTDSTTVAVTAVNDNPQAGNDDASVGEDDSVLIDVLADDTGLPDTGETLTITSVTEPEHGTAIIEDNKIRYTPDENYSGGDSFTYTISDGNGGTATAEVTVTVNPVNDKPEVPEVDLIRVKEGQTRTITLPAEDLETPASALVFKILSLPGLGTLIYNGEPVTIDQEITGAPVELTYTLPRSPSEVGATAFTYEVTDTGDGASSAITSEVMTVGLDLIEVGEPKFIFDSVIGAAFIDGTDASDEIVLTVEDGNLTVTVDDVVLDDSAPITSVRSVRVFGLGGNDLIDASAIDRPVYLQGGWGDDTLISGSRRDVLDGRQGDDSLTGGNHHDLLIGSEGLDDLDGGSGRDVLIGGSVPASSTYGSLRTIAQQWANTFRPVSPFSTGEGITDDAEDGLAGGTGADWFIRNLGDVLDRSVFQGDRATTLA